MQRIGHKYRSFAEADRAEDQYYSSLTGNERVALLLELVRQYRESIGEAAEGFERVFRVTTLEES